jgi:hypothetical protein
MTARTKPYGILVVLLVAAMISTACGGSHNPTGPVDPTPPPAPVRVIVGTILGFEINPMTYGVSVQTREIPANGMLDAVVPYTPRPDDNPDVRVFVFNNQQESVDCFPNTTSMANCPNALARSTSPQNPQRLTFQVLAGHSYRVNIRNRGSAPVSGTAEVGFTPDR